MGARVGGGGAGGAGREERARERREGYTSTGRFHRIPLFTTDTKARRAIEDLEEQLAKIKREMNFLQMDWADTLDKVKKMMQRIAKRAEIAEKLEAESETSSEVEAPIVAVPNGPEARRQIIAAAMRRMHRRT